MDQVILSPIPKDELYRAIALIVAEAVKAHAPEPAEKLLSRDEACQIFQPAISVKSLSRWTANGLINKHCIGSKVFYKHSEILAAAKVIKKFKSKTVSHD